MKKNKKIFLENLSCGISRMKRNNNIKLLRGPRTKFYVTYDDMMPGVPEDRSMKSGEQLKETNEGRQPYKQKYIQIYTSKSKTKKKTNKMKQNGC